MLLACSYPRMAPIYFVSKTMNTCTRQLSVLALLTPMNHSLQRIIVSSACEGEDFEMYAYCAMVPEGLMPYFRARCTCIEGSATNAQAMEVALTLLVPESFPLPRRSFCARTSWPTIRS
jgi:hypothetical protein